MRAGRPPVACVLGLLVAACAHGLPPDGPPRRGPEVTSNLVRADYAGSRSCRGCHPAAWDAWHGSPMHQMTRLPHRADVRAPFDGRTWSFKQDTLAFETHGEQRFMRLRAGGSAQDRLYRVTKVIGGRYREDYAGLEVTGTAADARVLGDPRAELILPASYVFETGSFRLKGYSVLVGERPGLRAGGVWNQTCVLCHNTSPLFASLWGALHGPGAPSYQGTTVDRTLPPDRQWRWEVKDRGALRAALDAEVAVLTGGAGRPAPDDLRAALKAGITSMRQHLGPDHFVEIGIGCEACHGGSRQHVDDPTLRPSFLPKSPFLEARPADGRREIGHAEAVNRACARCHQVLFSRYPYTWEGGQRHGAKPPGGSHVNSGEARDLLLGGCSRSMSCSTCHDPHAADRPEALAALATPAGNATCTTCHPRYATPEAVRAHTHHDPRGAGGVCLNCHMPRKNVALDYRLTRYHRVGSPTEPAKVLGDRPLECALCHPQDSTERLVDAMERFWGKRYDRAALRALYGDLRRPILAATLARGLPHEQLVAIGVAREQGRRELLPLLVPQLVHRLPLVRHHALAAVNALRERPCDVDLDRQTEAVVAAAQACLPPGARWLAPNRAPDPVEPDEDD